MSRFVMRGSFCLLLLAFVAGIHAETQVKRPYSDVNQDSLVQYFGEIMATELYREILDKRLAEGDLDAFCKYFMAGDGYTPQKEEDKALVKLAMDARSIFDGAIREVFFKDVVDGEACRRSCVQSWKNPDSSFRQMKHMLDFFQKYMDDKKQKYAEHYIDSITRIPGIVKTAEGSYYRITRKGKSVNPDSGICFSVEHRGYDKDGDAYEYSGEIYNNGQYDAEQFAAIAKAGIGGEIFLWPRLDAENIGCTLITIKDSTMIHRVGGDVQEEEPSIVAVEDEKHSKDTMVPLVLHPDSILQPRRDYANDPKLSEGYLSIVKGLFTSSSFYSNQNLPDYAGDGDLNTVWMTRSDENALEQSLYAVSMPHPYQKICDFDIYNGHWSSEQQWKEYARIKELILYINGKMVGTLELEDVRGGQHFNLPESKVDSCYEDDRASAEFRFQIKSIYPGTKSNEVALSEIVFMATNFACIAAGTPVNVYETEDCLGKKLIEELVAGDVVQQLSADRKSFCKARVVKNDCVIHQNVVALHIENHPDLLLTNDHPISVVGKGWCSLNPERTRSAYPAYQEVRELEAGDKIWVAIGDKVAGHVLRAVTSVQGQMKTYLLTLDGGDNVVAGGVPLGVRGQSL